MNFYGFRKQYIWVTWWWQTWVILAELCMWYPCEGAMESHMWCVRISVWFAKGTHFSSSTVKWPNIVCDITKADVWFGKRNVMSWVMWYPCNGAMKCHMWCVRVPVWFEKVKHFRDMVNHVWYHRGRCWVARYL